MQRRAAMYNVGEKLQLLIHLCLRKEVTALTEIPIENIKKTMFE